MKFYDREIETETLRRIETTSREYAQMTVITGRRRIGKTTLIKHAYEGKEMIYFFVARKSESTEKVLFFKDQNEKCLRFITFLSTNRLNKAMIGRKRRVKRLFLRY